MSNYFRKNNIDNIIKKQDVIQMRMADIITFLLLYLGCETSLKTADGIENCANVIHKERVGMTNIYNAIPCSFKSLDKSILLRTERLL